MFFLKFSGPDDEFSIDSDSDPSVNHNVRQAPGAAFGHNVVLFSPFENITQDFLCWELGSEEAQAAQTLRATQRSTIFGSILVAFWM